MHKNNLLVMLFVLSNSFLYSVKNDLVVKPSNKEIVDLTEEEENNGDFKINTKRLVNENIGAFESFMGYINILQNFFDQEEFAKHLPQCAAARATSSALLLEQPAAIATTKQKKICGVSLRCLQKKIKNNTIQCHFSTREKFKNNGGFSTVKNQKAPGFLIHRYTKGYFAEKDKVFTEKLQRANNQ